MKTQLSTLVSFFLLASYSSDTFGIGPRLPPGAQPETTKAHYISPKGDDTNNLTQGATWKTFGKVLDNIKPSDVVNLMILTIYTKKII